jgi:hypothetical protein
MRRDLIGLLLLLVVVVMFVGMKEGFDNSGALMQLASSHVATAGEVRKEAEERQREVEHDLIDMTGNY